MPSTLEGQLTMEKTPSYFVTKEAPGRIHKLNPHMKLILVVRDPVTRAISDYTQSLSKRDDVKPFEQMAFVDNRTGIVDVSWGAIKIGIYAKHIDRWLAYFPLSQIHVVSGERLIEEPAKVMQSVQNFLGLKTVISDKHFYFNATKGFPCLKKPEHSGNPHCLGRTKGRPHPHINPLAIERLRQFFKPFNRRFYRIVGRDFGWDWRAHVYFKSF